MKRQCRKSNMRPERWGKKSANSGSALVWATISLVVLLIIVGATITMATGYHSRSVRENSKKQAYLTARSVVNSMTEELKGNFEGDLSTNLVNMKPDSVLEMGEVAGLSNEMGSCNVRITKAKTALYIEATATFGGQKSTVVGQFGEQTFEVASPPVGGFDDIVLGRLSGELTAMKANDNVFIEDSVGPAKLTTAKGASLQMEKDLYCKPQLVVDAKEENSYILGKIVSDNNVTVDGKTVVGVRGGTASGIETKGKVTINGDVKVYGDIKAKEIEIGGTGYVEIFGNLTAEFISIAGNAIIEGNVDAQTLIMDDRAMITNANEVRAAAISIKDNTVIQTARDGHIDAANISLGGRARLSTAGTLEVPAVSATSLTLADDSSLKGSAQARYFKIAKNATVWGPVKMNNFINIGWNGVFYGDVMINSAQIKKAQVVGKLIINPNLPQVSVPQNMPPPPNPTYPAVAKPTVIDPDTLPAGTVIKEIGNSVYETVGKADGGTSYYRVTKNGLKDLTVIGTGNVYIYVKAGVTMNLEVVSFVNPSPVGSPDIGFRSKLYIVAEPGSTVQLSINSGDSFYGYVYGEPGSHFSMKTRGSGERYLYGGLYTDVVEAEKSASPSIQKLVVRNITTTGSGGGGVGTPETISKWNLTQYLDALPAGLVIK